MQGELKWKWLECSLQSDIGLSQYKNVKLNTNTKEINNRVIAKPLFCVDQSWINIWLVAPSMCMLEQWFLKLASDGITTKKMDCH